MVEKIICSNCNGEHIKKDGKRKTENRGLIQRYKCLSCNKRFIQDDGFFRMRNSPLKITQSIDLYYRGASTRGVQGHLAMFFPHNASNVSVYSWVVKYSKMISRFTNKLKLNVGKEAQADEIEYHRRKSNKAKLGTEKNFFIDSIDTQTRFMLSAEYMKTRSCRDIKAVISRIKERTDTQVQMVTTDGWNGYVKTIKKVFGYNNKTRQFNVYHNRNICIKDEGNFNHPIERLHNNIRARTKTMRGFHGSISSANAILKGWEIYYNFVNKQQAIKCCPYELATDLKLNDKNKWLELIQLSKK
jgi:transposase-like protein